MNLAFKYKDELFWIQNFLPKNLYKEMYSDFIKHRNKLNFQKTHVDWRTYKEEVDDMSESFNQDEFIKMDYFKKYHTLLRHQKFVNIFDNTFHSHLRKFNYMQHLTWHDDAPIVANGDIREYAATYYFNKTWGESWGAEFMYKTSEGSGFIPVIGNSLVIVKAGIRHRVNANLKKTHPRLSIQTWIHKEKEKA